jgi:cbb3-type cytochrome oxidase maturation protein
MSITYLLVVLGLGALALAVAAMFWAVDSGQFDDLEGHASRALEDDAVTTDARAPRRCDPDPPAS